MGTKDPRVDAYIEQAQPFAKPILRHLQRVVHTACPDVVETMKRSFPHFDYKGIFCGMASFKAHCTFGFWKASLLEGLAGVDKDAMGQFGRIASLDDLPSEKKLTALVKQAAKLNDEGITVQRVSKGPRPALTAPEDLVTALKKHKKAQTAWDALSLSHRREYVEWVLDAKQPATRGRRIATTVEWVAEGKGRNWQYESK
ncbi:MAG: YdeI/OmpD-associated family protein [Vicinamibacterales bacterium]